MNNPHQKLFEYCMDKKQESMELAESKNSEARYNACQAINAWDELAGQLHKPNPVSVKRFEKTKNGALRIVNLMTKGGYREETKQEIMALELPKS